MIVLQVFNANLTIEGRPAYTRFLTHTIVTSRLLHLIFVIHSDRADDGEHDSRWVSRVSAHDKDSAWRSVAGVAEKCHWQDAESCPTLAKHEAELYIIWLPQVWR